MDQHVLPSNLRRYRRERTTASGARSRAGSRRRRAGQSDRGKGLNRSMVATTAASRGRSWLVWVPVHRRWAARPRHQRRGEKAARLCSQPRTWSTFATATAPDRTWLTDITEHPPQRARSASVRSTTCTPTASWATRTRERRAGGFCATERSWRGPAPGPEGHEIPVESVLSALPVVLFVQVTPV